MDNGLTTIQGIDPTQPGAPAPVTAIGFETNGRDVDIAAYFFGITENFNKPNEAQACLYLSPTTARILGTRLLAWADRREPISHS